MGTTLTPAAESPGMGVQMGRQWGNRSGSLCLASVLAMTVAGSPAVAQAVNPPAVPESASPTRDDLQPVQPAPVQDAPRLSVIDDIERSPCPLADPRFADVTVPVNDVVFNNLKGASAEEMRPAWAEYAGTTQPIAVLCEIRDRAATILRNRGFLAAVQVPTQRIEGGAIRMEMLYARITAIRARGQTQGAEGLIARYLAPLTRDEIFDRNRAERYLLLARDLPGYNVQLTLKPAGTGPGELIGEVTVLRQSYVADATIQNLSSRNVGRWGGQVRAQFFGLTGMGDATSISFYSTSDLEEQNILQLAHEFRVGGEGLKIGAQFTHAWTEPDTGDPAFILQARTLFASVNASYPLIRRQSHSVTVGASFDAVNQKVDFIGLAPISRDKLRVLGLQVSGQAIDLESRLPQWRMAGDVELRQGVNVLSARDCYEPGCFVLGGIPTSRPDGKAEAGLIRASGVAEFALPLNMTVAVSSRVQFAFDRLLAFEEFSGGNYTIGRGFDPGTISGDSGIASSVELRAPTFELPDLRSVDFRPYVFVDAARAWSVGGRMPTDGSLVSLGVGIRTEISNRFRIDAMVAAPTYTSGFNGSDRARFLVSITTRLLPWSNR